MVMECDCGGGHFLEFRPLVLQEDYNDMFRPYMVHLQVVTGLSDQLYRNAWGLLGEFWGMGVG